MIIKLIQALSDSEENIHAWLGDDLMYAKTLLLYLLLEKDKTSPSELAKSLHLSRGRMSHLLDDMEADDLVKRQDDPEDGRGFLIALTAHGRGVAEKAKARVIGLESATRESLGEAGLMMLIEQLETFASLDTNKSQD